jgi:hypothetical protein
MKLETAQYVVNGKLMVFCHDCDDVREFINIADCGKFIAADCKECGTTKTLRKRNKEGGAR